VRFPNIVPVAGWAEYRNEAGTPVTLALLQAFVMNQGDGWDYTVSYLTRFLEERRTDVAMADDVHGAYLELVKTLATRTAELQRPPATRTADEAFAPERIQEDDIARWRQSARAEAQKTLDMLQERVAQLPSSVVLDAQQLLGRRALLLKRLGASVPQ